MSREDQHKLAHIALNRFGLGARPGGVLRIADDPKAAIEEELNTRGIARIRPAGLPTYKEACQAVHTSFERENGIKEQEVSARLRKHLEPEIGFVERLVLFFSNHFSMTINKDGAIRATIGQMERDVIRANVLGSFEDMLIGVMHHPAMLAYLDNADSIGPNSRAGRAWGAGLNENLGRELLELHTLGVGGGYTQRDVGAMARILSGWSYVRGWEADGRYNDGRPANRGQFIFRPGWHEPGSTKLLGKTYPGTGISQCRAALSDLALHPSTAQYLAFKLVRHFITDTPTPELVKPVTQAYRSSKGNLKATAQALLDLPEAWTLPLTKLRLPYELQVAEMRAMLRTYPVNDRWAFYEPLRALRNAPWERPAPDGYTDESAYWMGPDAMRIRLETAQLNSWSLQNIKPYSGGPVSLADSLFGKALSPESRQAVVQAKDRSQGLALVFMIPEFQRR